LAQVVSAEMGARKDLRVVVFLDVDGVLHSLHGTDFFVEECMQTLKRIMHGSGASIVLSSTWRTRADQVVLLNRQLRSYGISEVQDQTKDFANGQHRFHRAREEEICEWLDRHPEVTSWVVLDDLDLVSADSEQAMRLRGHFVKTESEVGLRYEHVPKALECLGLSPGGRELVGSIGSAKESRPSISSLKDVRPSAAGLEAVGQLRGLGGPLHRRSERTYAPRMYSSSTAAGCGPSSVPHAVSPAVPIGVRAGGSRGTYRTVG
jgi:hypothetical protein